MHRYHAELLWRPDDDELAYLPEGPWPLGADSFSWVSIQHGPDETTGSLNVFDAAASTNARFRLPGRPGFAAPTRLACVMAPTRSRREQNSVLNESLETSVPNGGSPT